MNLTGIPVQNQIEESISLAQFCEICGERTTTYSTCDTCEAIYCIGHLGGHNECPLCQGEHTHFENF